MEGTLLPNIFLAPAMLYSISSVGTIWCASTTVWGSDTIVVINHKTTLIQLLLFAGPYTLGQHRKCFVAETFCIRQQLRSYDGRRHHFIDTAAGETMPNFSSFNDSCLLPFIYLFIYQGSCWHFRCYRLRGMQIQELSETILYMFSWSSMVLNCVSC